ncbi:alpha/beta hydrolase [Neorhodopirellula pilleata]|uniref:Phospholipase/Carboxylesterase n=1 Tax=Neorhodopirellula pilleata TaxID=2714738 RepID=A0A5C6AQE5_9BACT|nr:phospholipase [Neorhodopirellula pilleata]TWU01940.1 Phospholipase/Carboxylesterase [Neorhodopirellula pilleata]
MSGSFSPRWSRSNHSHEKLGPQEGQNTAKTSTVLASPFQSFCQIVTPLHFQTTYQYPLLVWLHSAGASELQIEQILPHISSRNYVGVGVRATYATDVQGSGFDWQSSQNGVRKACQNIFDAIEMTSRRHSIHPDRIILAGLGSGATMACRVAMQHPNAFAGVIRMSGRLETAGCGLGKFNQLRQRRLPMLWQQAMDGVDDDSAQLRRDITTAQWLQAQVEIRQYPGNDVVNTAALKDIDRWCFDKIVTPSPATDSSTAADTVNIELIQGSELKMVEFSAN